MFVCSCFVLVSLCLNLCLHSSYRCGCLLRAVLCSIYIPSRSFTMPPVAENTEPRHVLQKIQIEVTHSSAIFAAFKHWPLHDGTFTYIIYIKFVNIYGLRACGSVSIYVESQSRLNAFLRYITPPFPLPPFFALLLNQNAPASQVFLSVYACYPAAPFHTKRNIYGLK